MKCINGRIGCLFLCWVGLLEVASGQSRSPYNLNHAKVALMNGTTITGEILAAIGDSLILLDKNRIVPGDKIALRLPGQSHDHQALVQEVTDEILTVLLLNSSTPEVSYEINRQSIRSMHFLKRANNEEAQRSMMTVLHADKIKSIRVQKKGMRVVGFVTGILAGTIIGTVIGKATYQPKPATTFTQVFENMYGINEGPVIAGFTIGGLVGVAVGTTGTQVINGDQENFKAWINRIYRRRS